MFCTNCGQKKSDLANFCHNCGNKLENNILEVEEESEPETEINTELELAEAKKIQNNKNSEQITAIKNIIISIVVILIIFLVLSAWIAMLLAPPFGTAMAILILIIIAVFIGAMR